MSLLLFSNSLTSLSPSPSSTLLFAASATPVSRLQFKPIDLQFNGVRFQNATLRSKTVLVSASSDIDGASPVERSEPPAESKEEVVPVDKLPLESKLQERMEQKMRMKMAKKIRLRRKRLVRKRRLRKKGRWPPSKMKKLKNV
ncbi:large ribosomal subunit protein cL37 [Euphorbia lathyris]|uniref:large ribosomal subunit protein cL37 n=1 Tax=Euphorbia lathyris TaxID=212925 RepID=UPI00331354B8